MLANDIEIGHLSHQYSTIYTDPTLIRFGFTGAFPSISRPSTIEAGKAFAPPPAPPQEVLNIVHNLYLDDDSTKNNSTETPTAHSELPGASVKVAPFHPSSSRSPRTRFSASSAPIPL